MSYAARHAGQRGTNLDKLQRHMKQPDLFIGQTQDLLSHLPESHSRHQPASEILVSMIALEFAHEVAVLISHSHQEEVYQ